MEKLEASKVARRVTGLVSFETIVSVRNVVQAFSANFLPNLVSRLDLLCFLC